ncbi:UNVERIFIED_CONTAM: protein suppressor of quenching 1, chloroplastic [Sesamum indicum]
MALRSVPSPFATGCSRTHFRNLFFLNSKSRFLENQWQSRDMLFSGRRRVGGRMVKACVKLEEKNAPETGNEWGKVSAVLFDMDGVLCNSEELSRLAGVDVFKEMGVEVTVQDFVPFMGTDLKEAYIADSESSSIRALDLRTGGSRLLAGGDPIFSDNLFKFGDHDGVGSEVLLQHPLGVFCGNDGQIYMADSYNHKIKKLDLASRRVTTLAGIGKAGFKDGSALEAQLSEPSGLVEAGNGRIFIADTNNSIIRVLDLNNGEPRLLTLELKGVQPPVPKSKSLRRLRRRSAADTETIVIDGGSSNEGKLCLKISVPEGYHLSKEAQSKFSVEFEPENAALVDPVDGTISTEGSAVIQFKRSSPSSSKSRIYCKVYYCKEDEVCLYQPLMFEVSFQEAIPDAAPAEISLPYVVKPKSPTYNSQSPLPR